MQEIFNQYLNYLQVERNASQYTVRNYSADLYEFFQFVRSRGFAAHSELDRNAIRDYLSHLTELGICKASIARKLSAIRSYYRYLLREEIISESPAANTSSPKLDKRLPEFLTIDEIKRLIEAPDLTTPLGLRDRAFLELLYASGLRVSELVKLNVEQLNLDTREIRVWGKGSKERMTLMGEPAARAIATYISQGRPQLLSGKGTSSLFLNRYGGRLTVRSVQSLLQEYANMIGIGKRVHPHVLRHTFATHLLDGGADLRVVQELLGHASLSSTQIYTHVSKSQARKVYLTAHPLARETDNDSESK